MIGRRAGFITSHNHVGTAREFANCHVIVPRIVKQPIECDGDSNLARGEGEAENLEVGAPRNVGSWETGAGAA